MLGNLLTSLGIGAALVMAITAGLYWGLRLGALQASATSAAIALALYAPVAILRWPGADILAIHLAIYLIIPLAFGLIMGAREQRLASEMPHVRRNHIGPVVMIGFYVVLVTVDSVFVMLADQGPTSLIQQLLPPLSQQQGQVHSTFPGVVSYDYQKKESQYNDYLAQLQQQKERGWQVRKGWLTLATAGKPNVFQVEVLDRDGQPIQAAQVQGRFLRPSDSRLDQNFEMHEVQPGLYQVHMTLSAPVAWDVVVNIVQGTQRLELRASTTLHEARS